MKILTGYLIDRSTGLGIAGEAVEFQNLAGAAFASQASPYIGLDAVTDGDGRFEGRFELSPGPVNIEVTVSGSEVKVRKHDENAQLGYAWTSDIRNLARAFKEGIISGFLNEMAVSIPAGHTIRIATGAAVFNGNVFSIENGNHDIAGTDNTNPALNPRLDLITLRQYNEDATGQDAGRQDIVVTLGTSQNVAPATPTGATFKDYPLAVVSTAYNAATKTVVTDLRTFVGNITPAPPLLDTDYNAGPIVFDETAYVTMITPTVTGLDIRRTYDGEIYFYGSYNIDESAENDQQQILLRLNSAFMEGGVITDQSLSIANLNLTGLSTEWFMENQISFQWPVVGVTGVTSLAIPVEFKLAVNPSRGGTIVNMSSVRGWLRLRERR